MVNKTKSRILEILDSLPTQQAEQLLEFAEFMHQRHGTDQVSQDRLDIPRPESETVVEAIKRLTKTFPMLDPASLFSETSGFMSESLIGGKPAKEVIDKLEALFRERYEAARSDGTD